MYKDFNINNIRYQTISKQDFVLALDRLTRFKYPEIKYYRVFIDLITKYLIEPKLSKKDIYELPVKTLKELVSKIWNESLLSYGFIPSSNRTINKILLEEMLATYNLSADIKSLVDIDINIVSALDFIVDYESSPVNIKRLLKLVNSSIDAVELRLKYGLRFPLEKVILCEGITEEILLPKFAKLSKYDFDKQGVRLVSAGGKNQVAKMYCTMKDELKIPIFVLLDADALETKSAIDKMLRPIDKIYLIKRGEFEDIFSLNLIKRTINNRFKNICECHVVDFKHDEPMTRTLAEFFRIHELGDFQKADFAKELSQNLKYETDLTEELIFIVDEIKSL